MSLSATRINLLPTARTLATGVPVANGLNRFLPPTADAHGHDATGPRSDLPPSWSFSAVSRAAVTHINAPSFASLQTRRFSTSALRRSSGPTPGSGFLPSAGANQTATIQPHEARDSTGVPDFSAYKVKGTGEGQKTLSYFMVGTMGVLAASGAKSAVSDILSNMAASADVLALAKIEVEMGAIPEGKNLIVKWRGKPVFIRHRTADEIDEANAVDVKTLRDPQQDSDRAKRPEWLVMLGVCTHLGCVPIGEAGDYGGWFCPCHGSHYDISGRIRRGPAPLNLEIPEYDFNDAEEKIVIG
ncbi:Rieske [2Fe-2S] iron-sulfur domain-containing protein [Papiliotrema laurentii]|uniref:Cytochrome b-c1 complex subunit Rieske, mitochondrial n=1 Tax=Papiliotrema laurentii TaxID=5418 RepID=A0AAD9CY95_PAPLA|nr:Rieske [2Fe-2S] iron-sulfur domain-containing protein [Papiliotrema laurentii]